MTRLLDAFRVFFNVLMFSAAAYCMTKTFTHQELILRPTHGHELDGLCISMLVGYSFANAALFALGRAHWRWR